MLKVAARRLAALVTLSAQLGACATAVPADTAFGPQSAAALLVMAAPPADNAEYTVFRRVDLATGQFQGELITIVNAGFGGHQINGDTKSGIWLSPQEVPAGDYTITSWGIVEGNYTNVRCWTSGSPVFSVPASKITIVAADRSQAMPGQDQPRQRVNQIMLDEFATARTKYPNITGAASVAPPIAVIEWEEIGINGFVEGRDKACGGAPSFKRVR